MRSNTRARLILTAALLACACSKTESSGTVDLIKDVASESRTKPRVIASIKLDGEQPAPADLALQKSIEDKIETSHIGRLISSGSNAGFLNITVEVENTADGIAKLRQVMNAAGVLKRSSFRVSSGNGE